MAESKKTRASTVVTLEELRLLKLVADLRNSTVSDQLRLHSVGDLIDAGRRAETAANSEAA